jgi:hypothetical protein
MIKFSGVENEEADSERETNFVRQKTPHPRELKVRNLYTKRSEISHESSEISHEN